MAKKKTSTEPEYPENEQNLAQEPAPEHMDADTAVDADAGAVKEEAPPNEEMAEPGGAFEETEGEQILSLDIVPLPPEPTPDNVAAQEVETEALPGADLPLEGERNMDLKDKPESAESMPAPKKQRAPSDRQSFFELDFNELDRHLSAEERQEWNSVYASYRGRSVMTGTIIGVDRHTVSVRNRQTGKSEQQEMYCAIVVPFRVRIVIPETEMWEPGQERPGFVLQNMVGASIDFVIMKVDREGGFAIASRRMASRARRYFFSRRPALHSVGARLKCQILSVGPRRCLVECHGHDIGLTQREIRYTAIPDLRTDYHPGEELDCIIKEYDPESDRLLISVKEITPNPFDGAELRHPVGSRRQAVIAGKYGGGVFCNLPDGTVCMCAYAFQHEDSEFQIGDTAIVAIQRYDMGKKQIYGKIITKW